MRTIGKNLQCMSIECSAACNQIFTVDGLRWRSRENQPLPQSLDFRRPQGGGLTNSEAKQQSLVDKREGGAKGGTQRGNLLTCHQSWVGDRGGIVCAVKLYPVQLSRFPISPPTLTSDLVPGQLLRPALIRGKEVRGNEDSRSGQIWTLGRPPFPR